MGIVLAEEELLPKDCRAYFVQSSLTGLINTAWCVIGYAYQVNDTKICDAVTTEGLVPVERVQQQCYETNVDWEARLNDSYSRAS